jgi:hypothetical protein
LPALHSFIDPRTSDAALREALVLHLLSERTFRKVFDTPYVPDESENLRLFHTPKV